MSAVSVPEKTLEHWASQYVLYRYRTHAALWWPSRGEDLDVRWLPSRPGKAVQLELKTTRVAGAGLHDVWVDLGQLWDYRRRPVCHQPFYAFPWPEWSGDLTAAARNAGRSVTELAFMRGGSGWWFADWMVVLTTAQVAEILSDELADHDSPQRDRKERLVRLNLHQSTVDTWGRGAARPETIDWRTFWTTLEQCGKADWPQMIRLPARWIRARQRYPQSEISGLLWQTTDTMDTYEDADLVTLAPDADGIYQVVLDPASEVRGRREDRPDETEDHRQVVFLDARALFPIRRSK